MKVPNSVSAVYNDIFPRAVQLQEEMTRIMPSIKHPSWHYFSRIKSEESFALKLETGRVEKIKELNDFFACTLVVKNKGEIQDALRRIRTHFNIIKRKPREDNFTHKESSSFEFDDLRLYVSIKPPDYLPPSPINDFVFEIQVKTFLEHAWSIATHDLIYKSDSISWPKERVAFQVKAMLELAEASINSVETLSQSPELAKQNRKTQALNRLKDYLVAAFPPESLPADLLRLSRNIMSLLESFNLREEQIEEMVEKETAIGRGTGTLDLSPYSIILQTIIYQAPQSFSSAFTADNKHKSKKIFIPKEVDITGTAIEDHSRIVIS
jgi:ppGpp synthetase/RelA/SpoT-type nucleotidyltranferase